MDVIEISDDDQPNTNFIDENQPIVHNNHFNMNYENDEIIAIQLEMAEIDEQMKRLQQQRSYLNKRLKKLKNTARLNSRPITLTTNINENWKRTNFPWSFRVEKTRTEVFKIDSFRPWQLETINVTLAGHDCILIMPTGGGKSLCYQLPALISDGITIVVSPLISLVEDQIYALQKLNIDARTLNATTSHAEQKEIMQILDGKIEGEPTLKILYLTPEKIAKNRIVMSKLQNLYDSKRFARLIIDEVHCVSQYGHDFRPDYKYLSIFKRQFPKLSILGLTATATLRVINDIRQILNIPGCVLFRAPFNRKNLFYEVYHKSSVGKAALKDLVQCIKSRFDNQSGIVYCLSQKDTEEVCLELEENGIKTGCYHAGLSALARTEVHEKWLNNQVHVICATIAFGMGIDKPDVRFVIHHSLSKSIENFYQESGRAGRDNQQSHCILFFRFGDVFRLAPMVFSDRSGNGLTNLHSMISYCLNESECRRKSIAKYFDEVWQSNDCNQMCDTCLRSSTSIIKRNCREEALILIDYLKIHKKPRLTALKLIEKLAIKTMNKIDVQRLVLKLIIEQYLKEDFRFTRYSTICYIKLGPRAESINNANCQILLDIVHEEKKIKSTKTKTPEQSFVDEESSSPPDADVKESKLKRITNVKKPVKTNKRKVRTLQYDDDEIENAPILKKQAILSEGSN